MGQPQQGETLNFHQEYLTLIQQTLLLLKEEPLILASPEEAAFFRQRGKQKKESYEPPSNLDHFTTSILQDQNIASPTKIAPEKKQKPPIEPTPIEPPLLSNSPKSNEPTLSYLSLSSFFPLFAKIAPEIALLKKIPDDTLAKKIAARWKTKNQTAPLTLLMFSEPEPHQKFLQEIAKALDIYFGPAKIVQAETIEKEKQWEIFLSSEELKLIIVCDYTLWQLNGLMQFYKEVPAQGTRLLGKTNLFLLPDLSLYLKDPLLKRSLWKALCQKIS